MTVRRLLAALLPVLLAAALVGISSSSIRAAAAPARQRVSLHLGATQVEAGRPVTATGRLRPAVEGRLVRLQVRDGARWRTVAKDRQDRRGKVSYVVSTSAPGTVRYRLKAPAKRALPAVRSKARTLTVLPVSLPVSPGPGTDGTVVPLTIGGVQPDAPLIDADLSADARFVAVVTKATNLAGGETDALYDVFWADLVTGEVRKVSRTAAGGSADYHSSAVGISGDGQRVVFTSAASNLVGSDSNGADDVFLYDVATARLQRLSNSTVTAGRAAFGTSQQPDISADGATVVFRSDATDLVPGSSGNQIYAVDLRRAQTTLLTGGYDGSRADGGSQRPTVSADGSKVAVLTHAKNLAPGMSTASGLDIVRFDRTTNTRTWVNPRQSGQSAEPTISPDGWSVAYRSLHGPSSSSLLQIQLWDARTGLTRVVSRAGEVDGDNNSGGAGFSKDGRRVVFLSWSTNLVAGSAPESLHVYSADLATGALTLVTRKLNGAPFAGQAKVWADAAGTVLFDAFTTAEGYETRRPYVFRRCSEEYPC